jgi:hypothetical protein
LSIRPAVRRTPDFIDSVLDPLGELKPPFWGPDQGAFFYATRTTLLSKKFSARLP